MAGIAVSTFFVLLAMVIIIIKWCNKRWEMHEPMMYALERRQKEQWREEARKKRLEGNALKGEDTAPRSEV